MSNQRSIYQQIVTATSLFSGVQLFNIFFAILRTKIAALLIGPVGIGILGVLNATINMISGISKMGLDLSSVKEISQAYQKNEKEELSHSISALQKLLWITGISGTVITMIFSKWLSILAFDSEEYRFYIFWVSLAILFKQLTIGNYAVLQGVRKLRSLAKANFISSLLSVILVIPLYYFLGIEGIVPVIVLTSLSTYIISIFYSENKKYKADSLKSSLFEKGRSMMKLGAVLSVSTLLSLVAAYLLQVFITNTGGLTEVGYFNAGFLIVNSYVGLIFNAMSKDYFPRLSGLIAEHKNLEGIVSSQASTALLMLCPIVVIFLLFSPSIIKLLYTNEFLPVVAFVNFAILGTIFKAVSWCLGYVIIAEGDSKVFIRTAIGFNSLLLILNILGYYYLGLKGLGLSFLIYFIIHFIGMVLISQRFYKLKLEIQTLKVLLVVLLLSISAYNIYDIKVTFVRYIGSAIVLILALSYSIFELNKRVDLKALMKKILKKNDR